ncbi:hypothetical protein V8F20_005160 [Naviculisporaceae sp. PSN 640]
MDHGTCPCRVTLGVLQYVAAVVGSDYPRKVGRAVAIDFRGSIPNCALKDPCTSLACSPVDPAGQGWSAHCSMSENPRHSFRQSKKNQSIPSLWAGTETEIRAWERAQSKARSSRRLSSLSRGSTVLLRYSAAALSVNKTLKLAALSLFAPSVHSNPGKFVSLPPSRRLHYPVGSCPDPGPCKLQPPVRSYAKAGWGLRIFICSLRGGGWQTPYILASVTTTSSYNVSMQYVYRSGSSSGRIHDRLFALRSCTAQMTAGKTGDVETWRTDSG